MANRGQTKRAPSRTVYSFTINNSGGFTYVELLVTFSLTVFVLASILVLSGEMIRQGEQNADQLVLQREASALQFLVLNEMKQGYNFRTITGDDLFFQLDPVQTVKLQFSQKQLVRRLSNQGPDGPFLGNVLLSRHVDNVTFHPDADGKGVEIRLQFKKGEAVLTLKTYWRSRVEREEVL